MSRPAELADLEERSFWQATMPDLPDRRGRDLPDTADVVVIGGGYTGLSAARRAAELGASVVLLEAESLGWGASTRNGGMCHPGFKWGITSLRKRHGPELGERLYRESIEAFEAVATMCGPGGPIDADFSRSGHVELAFTPAHAAHQQATADALAQVDMPAHVVAREELRQEIGSDAYFGGLVVERSGGLHPGSSWRVSRRSPPLPGPTSTRASVPGRSAGRRTAARSSRHPDKPSSPATSSSPRTATRTAWPPRSGAGSCRSAATSSPPTRCPRTSRPRSARAAGCSSTRRTSSTTGGSRRTAGCCSAGAPRCGRRPSRGLRRSSNAGWSRSIRSSRARAWRTPGAGGSASRSTGCRMSGARRA